MKQFYEHRCGCGCEGGIEIKSHHKYYGIPKYINGHTWKNKKRPEHSERIMGHEGYWKNKKRPEISKRMMGKNNPTKRPEVRRKLSESKMGENHPNWLGGISCEPYCDVWLDKEFKKSIRDRDGNRCLNPDCWKTSTRLDIHHINYIKKDCYPLNLITLCNSCNTRANKDRDWHEHWYNAIIYRRYLNA